MGKVFWFLLVFALTACAAPTATSAVSLSPTIEPESTTTALPVPQGALTLVEFFAVS